MGILLFFTHIIYLGIIISFLFFIKYLFNKFRINSPLNKKIYFFLITICLFFLPYWDLFIQKGLKTYYQLFTQTEFIYEKPEFNKNGKIESLSIIYDEKYKYYTMKSLFMNSQNYTNLTQRELKNLELDEKDLIKIIRNLKFKEKYKIVLNENYNFIENFIDIEFKYKNYNKDNFIKLRYDLINKKFTKINKNDVKAKYYSKIHDNYHFFNLIKQTSFEIYNNNKIIYKGLNFSFPTLNSKEKFRYKYLFVMNARDSKPLNNIVSNFTNAKYYLNILNFFKNDIK